MCVGKKKDQKGERQGKLQQPWISTKDKIIVFLGQQQGTTKQITTATTTAFLTNSED
jgi:hypothetical protein